MLVERRQIRPRGCRKLKNLFVLNKIQYYLHICIKRACLRASASSLHVKMQMLKSCGSSAFQRKHSVLHQTHLQAFDWLNQSVRADKRKQENLEQSMTMLNTVYLELDSHLR